MISPKEVVVVTGAANGIGRVISETFAKKGYTVIAVDIMDAEFEHTNIHFIKGDLCSYDDICSIFRFAKETFGGVHILVNNAAISKFSKSIFEINPDEFKKVIDTNLTGSFMCSKQFIEANRGLEYGRIINIASTRWHQNEADWDAYGASKGGLVSLTNSMCVSLSDTRITVNAISPGWIECSEYDNLSLEDHKQHPSGRVGIPSDIARMVIFLAAPESDFINGANIIIDGGMTKKMIYHTSQEFWESRQ
ncbi:MAG: SDR family NAD(P)-dependent oxidoreductase [Bacteroidales bacterium]